MGAFAWVPYILRANKIRVRESLVSIVSYEKWGIEKVDLGGS